MTAEDSSVSVISRARLEFLFDGVFAIAMTILVLELKVPELADRRSVGELVESLVHEAPTFVSYLVSFVMLGVFWYRHNQHYRHFRVITIGMLVFHFVQLAAAAFFPFCAALMGRYPGNPLSIVVYLSCVLVYAWASLGNLLIAKRSGSLGADLTEEAYHRSRKRLLRGASVLSAMFVMYLIRVFVS